MAQALPIIISAAASSGGTALAGGQLGAIIGSGFLGAAVASLGLLTNRSKHQTGRGTDDVLLTGASNIAPVTVVLGRARLQTVIIAAGAFNFYKSGPSDSGQRYHVANLIVALGEGEFQATGNVHFDGQAFADVIQDQPDLRSAPPIETMFVFEWRPGTDDVTAPPDQVLDVGAEFSYGFTELNDAGNRVYLGSGETPYPWRNTDVAFVRMGVGPQPRLPQIAVDTVGPDLTIRRSGNTSELSPGDVVGYAFFDAREGVFVHTLTASSASSAPFGLVKVPRNGAGRSHMQPPTAVTASIVHGWYLSRHDVVVLQDPNDNRSFWIANQWGLARDSAAWEKHRPNPGYAEPIRAHYLDEVHGILHSLHLISGKMTILQWHLCYGWVRQLDTDLPDSTPLAFMYSTDLGAYVVASANGTLKLVDPDTGKTFVSTTAVNLGGCVGVAVSGQRILVIKSDAAVYFDPDDGTTEALGSNGTGITEGELGGTVSAHQNSWTGHVTLAKPVSGTVALINFIPSVLEDLEDISALGTAGEIEFQWEAPDWALNIVYAVGVIVRDPGQIDIDFPEWQAGQFYSEGDQVQRGDTKYVCGFGHFSDLTNSPGVPNTIQYWTVWQGNPLPVDRPLYECIQGNTSSTANRPGTAGGVAYWSPVDSTYPKPDPITDWVRDWSTRTYNAFNLVQLEGNSSVAAAMYAVMVDVPELDTKRWGGGFSPDYFSLPSFEAVHAQCVGGVKYANPRQGDEAPTYRFAERYKCDLAIDTESPVTEVVQTILTSINGFRYSIGGRLHVGMPRRGALPIWHFTEHSLADSATKVDFVAKGPNRVRVQFAHVRDEYRQQTAEANYEFDQNSRSRVINDTISAPSIGRHGHAEILAKHVLQISEASRRHVATETHFVAYLFTPGDIVWITHAPTGLRRMRAQIAMMAEKGKGGGVALTLVEHRPTLDALRDSSLGPPPGCVGTDCDGDDGGDTDPGVCEEARGGTGSAVAWFNGGASYAPGTYFLNYLSGAYKLTPDGGFAVEGYDLVMRTAAGEIVVLAPAPAVATPSGGWLTDSAAEDANKGQSLEVALPVNTPVGIRLRSGAAYTNTGPEGVVRYEFCLEEHAGQCETCPRGCDQGCTEPANVGSCWFGPGSIMRVQWAVDLGGGSSVIAPTGSMDLPRTALDGDVVTWSAISDGLTVTLTYAGATKSAVLRLVDDATEETWTFAATVPCAGGDLALDTDNPISTAPDASGTATNRLIANPNPGTGADCLTGNGCGDDGPVVPTYSCNNPESLPSSLLATGSGWQGVCLTPVNGEHVLVPFNDLLIDQTYITATSISRNGCCQGGSVNITLKCVPATATEDQHWLMGWNWCNSGASYFCCAKRYSQDPRGTYTFDCTYEGGCGGAQTGGPVMDSCSCVAGTIVVSD
ncbi:MAG TPA: phage tail protein [Tepidisphaeraceae bacterium]|nr:phage tail protein [Tepidisphaeraceae bacterium]